MIAGPLARPMGRPMGRTLTPERGGGAPAWVPDGAVVAYDFTTGEDWKGAKSLTRSTSAFALAGDGTYDNFAIDTLRRFDTIGATLEGALTGKLVRTMDFANASWNIDAGLSRAEQGTGPIEGFVATRFTRASGNARVFQSSISYTSGETYHPLALVKSADYRYAIFRTAIGNGGTSYDNYVFDLQTEALGYTGTGASNGAITALGSGWFQIEMDILCGGASTSSFYLYLSNVAPASSAFAAPTATGAYDVAYCDTPLRTGPFTPFTSVASAATRAADVLTLSPTPQFDLDWYATYSDDTSELLTGSVAGDYLPVADLTQPVLKMIWGTPAGAGMFP